MIQNIKKTIILNIKLNLFKSRNLYEYNNKLIILKNDK
jgi:hypothetical protein